MAEFPRDWQVDTIGNLAQLKAGRDRFETSHCDGDYPWYGGNGIRGYSSRHSYDGIYPIIGRQGELCGNVKLAKGKFSATEHAVVVTCKPEVVPEFFYYSLTFANLNQYATGCAQPGLSVQKIGAIPITLPAFDEQRRIADALGSVDKLIDNLTRRIEKKRLVKQGVMQELLTGKKRLPGYRGEWVERKIGSMLSIGHGKDYKGLGMGNIPVYGSGGYMCSVSGFLHDGPTVCIGRKGTIDKPFFHEGKIWTVDTLFYTHSFRDADPKFLYYAFLRVDWPALNTASGVPSLTAQTIEQLPLEVPADLDEQRAIASVLSGMDAEITNLEAKREKYEHIKQGMMNDLLTGKVRI